MTGARALWTRAVAGAILAALLPILVEAELVAWMRARGAATLMLGAASGASRMAIATMLLALLLRLYTVVALPGLCVAWIVRRAWSAAVRPPTTADEASPSNPRGPAGRASPP
jgi:hypothetical protein